MTREDLGLILEAIDFRIDDLTERSASPRRSRVVKQEDNTEWTRLYEARGRFMKLFNIE